ncbi:hypothetical protein [Cytobacillus massiliigabonensis]|uniref:hypothetical protein n=1 Tax=Cytobacillus massiliigabonensis TaxID=1871011 RepID=UPI0015E0E657|nr:hypothetical protein [Cytobacillus massiliigabonensis]
MRVGKISFLENYLQNANYLCIFIIIRMLVFIGVAALKIGFTNKVLEVIKSGKSS